MLMKVENINDLIQSNRRARLQSWIDLYCAGKQALFIEKTGINQGELSGLLKTKSFGEKKARAIEKSAGMPNMWLEEQNTVETGIYPEIEKTSLIPLISYVSAGRWCEAIDNYSPGDAEEWMLCPGKHSKHTYALRVRGDSMTSLYGKSYPDGSIIYVDPEVPYENGSRVIAKMPGCNEATFKQYIEDAGRRYLKPLNPQYPTIEIDDSTLICGVVIGQYIAG